MLFQFHLQRVEVRNSPVDILWYFVMFFFSYLLSSLSLSSLSLCEKYPNTEFFLVHISCIRTEYGEILVCYIAFITHFVNKKITESPNPFREWI